MRSGYIVCITVLLTLTINEIRCPPVWKPRPNQAFILEALAAHPRKEDQEKYDVENNGEYIQWRRLDKGYGVEFRGLETPFRLRRSLRSTQGEPWPLPQIYKPKETYYVINPKTFRMDFVSNITSDIIHNATNKYKQIIFKNSILITEDNLKNAPRSQVSDEVKYYKEELSFINADEINTLAIYVNNCCDIYPTLESNESYSLIVNSSGIVLMTQEVWGVLRGLETFSQLVTEYNGKHFIRETTIIDFPRYPHRGVMIDTSRHFIKKEIILEVLEGMAQNKMNVLHWHMVDDQSFPYQSEEFPELSRKGAYHPSMVYTLKDLADVIERARLLGIRVIPELDVPGHTYSWGLSFPELLTQCYVNKEKVPGFLGPLDPSNENMFKVLYKLFHEVFNVFKDQFVHLGGDEILTECWASNPRVIELFRTLYIKDNLRTQLGQNGPDALNFTKDPSDENPTSINNRIRMLEKKIMSSKSLFKEISKYVWGYFNKRLKTHLDQLGRQREGGYGAIMWEDALWKGVTLPNDTIIQVWKSPNNLRLVLGLGYRSILSSCWYLDHYQSGVHWENFYRCDPDDIGGYKGDLILGGEACLWTEYISNEMVMHMLWPRGSAVAERLWSSSKVRSMKSVSRRFSEHRCRMLRRGLDVGMGNGPEFCVTAESDNVDDENKEVITKSVKTSSPQQVISTEKKKVSRGDINKRFTPEMKLADFFLSVVGIAIVILMIFMKRRRR